MRRIFIGLLVLAFVLIGAAFIIPALIPADALRNAVQTQASTSLSRDVTLNGDIGLTILPRLEVRASEAEIANADGFGAEPFAEMREMRFSLALGPLISRRIEIDEFILIDPTIRLEQRGTANNWTLGEPSETSSSSNSSSAGFVRQPGALPFEASFGDVRIENGTISYSDGTQTRNIEDLNLAVSLPSVDEPVGFDGSMLLDGHVMNFDVELGSLRGFFEGAATPIRFNLTGDLADIGFNGGFLESSDISLDGNTNVTVPIRALARYLGSDLPESETFQRFHAQSDIAIRPGRISLSNGVIEFDDIVANRGTLTLDYDRTRPMVSGNLNVDMLDITPYIPVSETSETPSANTGVPAWSEEEMDFSPLRTMDADLNFTAGHFKALDIEADNVDINVVVDNGRMVATLSDFLFYSGAGQMTAVVNARSNRPSFSLNASMNGLEALPFLEAAAGFERLTGTGSVNLDLAASGASQGAIMRSLSGTGAFDFADGAIVGVNLAQVIRTIQQAVSSASLPSGFTEQEQTDFSSLTGTLQIQNGVAQNLDLSMLSPLLRVAGNGAVNLGEQNLDYLLTPTAVSTITGQGGDVDLNGLSIPIRLVGDFNDVDIRIDYGRVAQDLLRAEAGNLIGGDLGEVLTGGQSLEDSARDAATNALLNALGGNSDDEEEEADPASQLLRGILGGNRSRDDDDDSDNDN